jgi:heme exporter protein A
MESSCPATLAVDAREVSKRYGTRWALTRLSFTVATGESLLLTGQNGSGKTTLLRLLACAARPTLGSLKVWGSDVLQEAASVRQHTALLSHATFLYEDLTGAENLLLVARALRLQAEAVGPVLESVGLADRAHHPAREYSAGMRKRLSVGRLLLKRPRVALLDEPFGELDPLGISRMEGWIGQLQAGGSSVILATHQVEQGQALCRQRLHLEQGQAVAL